MTANVLTDLGWLSGVFNLPPHQCLIDFLAPGVQVIKFTAVRLPNAVDEIPFVALRREAVRLIEPTLSDEFVEAPVGFLHTVDYHLALLKPLGIENASRAIRLELPEESVTKADQFLHAAKVGHDFVCFHPGSARAEKFWEANRWAEVIDHCARETGMASVLTGGRSPIEQAQIAAIKAAAKSNPIDLSGKTNLLILAALVRKARLLVTVDSAPMHFAAAWDTPQVVLFGPTNPFHWHPRSESAIVLLGGNDGPMTEFDPKQRAAPMNEISTQTVIDAMEALLSAPAAPLL